MGHPVFCVKSQWGSVHPSYLQHIQVSENRVKTLRHPHNHEAQRQTETDIACFLYLFTA